MGGDREKILSNIEGEERGGREREKDGGESERELER